MRSITLLNIQPTLAEVKTAIKLMKNGKSAGIDGVMAEALKAGGEIVIQRLHSMLQLVWHPEKKIPTVWKRAIIAPIRKKGDSCECKNYSGISLLSIVGKVFMCIVQLRLQNYCEQITRKEQADFRTQGSCCNQIFNVRQLME